MSKSKRIVIACLIILVVIIVIYIWYRNKPVTKANTDQSNIEIIDPKSGYYLMPAALGLPPVQDIPGFQNNDSLIAYLQNVMDDFSWRSFIALNWPANKDGSPDSLTRLGETSEFTVFEHWMPSTSIYRKDGMEPREWNFRFLDKKNNTEAEGETGLRTIPELKKFSRRNADSAHIIDQQGNYTYYQIYYNRHAYDYVVQGKLYNLKGQEEFVTNWPSNTKGLSMNKMDGTPVNIEKTYKRLYFPVGNFKDTSIMIPIMGDSFMTHFTINPGAVIVKTAWRILTDNDDKSRFYTRKVRLEGNKIEELGLVGMHIAHKVSEATQWIWSTFEHNDNAPRMDQDMKLIIQDNVKYSYFDKMNKDTAIYNKILETGKEKPGEKKPPMQVVRVLPLEKSAEHLNTTYHDKIRASDPKSVWLNYNLIGTQWPFNPALMSMGDANSYTPKLLANTVLETTTQSTSSCMGCHSFARILNKDSISRYYGFNADFIFGLNNAK